jgi:hypothetical protein
LKDAWSDPVIRHFAGLQPWQNSLTIFAGTSWELCPATPFYAEILCRCIFNNVIVPQHKRSKLNYSRWKALSKLRFGKTKAHYLCKHEERKTIGNLLKISSVVFFMKNHLTLLNEILTKEEKQDNTTRVGTIGLFRPQLRFDLANICPVIMTKFVNLKAVIHELLCFVSGNDNVTYLQDNSVKI